MLSRLLCLLLAALPALADVAVPPRVLAPLSAAEAWNVIRLASANVERLIREERPLEVTSQISLLSPSLRILARHPVKDGMEAMVERQTTQAFQLVNLIARDSMAENTTALTPAFASLKKALDEIATGFEPAVVEGEIYHCLTHTDVLGTAGEKCPQCQQPLQVRRIPYSFIHARPEQPGIKLMLITASPAKVGLETQLTLRLQDSSGTPIRESDLWLMHTQSVQLLITGPQFADYHHLTAKATETPGEYTATFTPALVGTYRVRAGLTPAASGLPEYSSADLEVQGSDDAATPAPPEEASTTTVDGFRLSLSVAGSKGRQLRAGQIQMLHLQVQDSAGQPVNRLEPIQQAFAHLDAFYTHSATLLQLHPTGGDILRDDLRGGPALIFKIYSPEPGILRIFVRLRIDGKPLQAPFTLQVQP